MEEIKIGDILNLDNKKDYKLHLATHFGREPLDIFAEDRDEWKAWNESKKENNNEFNRKYIFSLIDYYQEKSKWLFGGIFEIIHTYSDRYEIKLSEKHSNLIGRLILSYEGKGMRGRSFIFERHYNKFTVSEILKNEYSGENFCGYENINHDFSAIKSFFKSQKLDWKVALENIKGVYMILDKKTEKNISVLLMG